MNQNFLNLHILTTTSIANQNRDDSGAPKQVTYGGATRHRHSSQALTRSKRVMFETATSGDQLTWRAKGGMVDLALLAAADLAGQTGQPLSTAETTSLQKSLTVAVNSLVQNRDKAMKAVEEKAKARAKADAKKTAAAVAAGETSGTADPSADLTASDTDDETDETGKKATLVWLAEHEVTKLAANALSALRAGTDPGDFVNKDGRTQSLSIAAFGRMFAFRPDLQNEAAVQRSHAFTTHAADVEPDYFTAVNDLPAAATGSGAGHLDLSQYGGGVFYWHCNIDRNQLWKTWIAGDDTAVIRARLISFFEALILALPSGKQATTAPKTVPDAVLAVPATAPVALHQAFETPIRSSSEGFRAPSLRALLQEHERTVAFTPRQFPENARYAGTLEAMTHDHITTEPSLDALITACVDWVLAGRPATD